VTGLFERLDRKRQGWRLLRVARSKGQLHNACCLRPDNYIVIIIFLTVGHELIYARHMWGSFILIVQDRTLWHF